MQVASAKEQQGDEQGVSKTTKMIHDCEAAALHTNYGKHVLKEG
jgi:hypothetical protein